MPCTSSWQVNRSGKAWKQEGGKVVEHRFLVGRNEPEALLRKRALLWTDLFGWAKGAKNLFLDLVFHTLWGKRIAAYTERLKAAERRRIDLRIQDPVTGRELWAIVSTTKAGFFEELRRGLLLADNGGLGMDAAPFGGGDMLHAMESLLHSYFPGRKSSFRKSTTASPPRDEILNLHLFRIFQEMLAIVRRRGTASSIEVEVRISTRSICFRVLFDGDGCGLEPLSSLPGLKTMHLRTGILGGKFSMVYCPSKGNRFIFLMRNEQL